MLDCGAGEKPILLAQGATADLNSGASPALTVTSPEISKNFTPAVIRKAETCHYAHE
jgi:hypothetical protein